MRQNTDSESRRRPTRDVTIKVRDIGELKEFYADLAYQRGDYEAELYRAALRAYARRFGYKGR